MASIYMYDDGIFLPAYILICPTGRLEGQITCHSPTDIHTLVVRAEALSFRNNAPIEVRFVVGLHEAYKFVDVGVGLSCPILRDSIGNCRFSGSVRGRTGSRRECNLETFDVESLQQVIRATHALAIEWQMDLPNSIVIVVDRHIVAPLILRGCEIPQNDPIDQGQLIVSCLEPAGR